MKYVGCEEYILYDDIQMRYRELLYLQRVEEYLGIEIRGSYDLIGVVNQFGIMKNWDECWSWIVNCYVENY